MTDEQEEAAGPSDSWAEVRRSGLDPRVWVPIIWESDLSDTQFPGGLRKVKAYVEKRLPHIEGRWVRADEDTWEYHGWEQDR